MSTVLIVGGDHVDGIKKIVSEFGHHQIAHWTGRKSGDHHKQIPQNTQLVVLVTSWINHSFTYAIKRAASKRQLKIVYATNLNHARQHLMEQLGEDGGLLLACRKTLHTLINHSVLHVANAT
jgi:hypothetical protein